MRRIDLRHRDYFKVISKVTNRRITVIGLLIDGDKILSYHIDGEGWWDANRFREIDKSITDDEFDSLEERVERLENILSDLRIYELKKDLEIF